MVAIENILTGLSVYIQEPVSAITDLMLAGISVYFFFSLKALKNLKAGDQDWIFFFLFFSFSTFAGGWAHSISIRVSNPVYDLVWLSMQLFSACAVFYAQRAAILSELNEPQFQKVFLKMVFIQLLVFAPCMFYFFSFKVVAINSSIAIIYMLSIYLFSGSNLWTHRLLIGTGFLLSVLTVYVNHTKLSFAKWFNHNDVSHLIMYFSLLLIYRGVKYKKYSELSLQKGAR